MNKFDSVQEYQVKHYPNFIEKIKSIDSTLYHCPLTLAELSHIIEGSEWGLYKQYHSSEHTISRKRFRAIKTERKAVVTEIEAAWNSINSMSICIEVNLTLDFTQKAQKIFSKSLLDSYDSFFTQVMNEAGLSNIITDDADFKSLDNKTVYTANPKLISN
jgi:predicted nucleic acid-binding protein